MNKVTQRTPGNAKSPFKKTRTCKVVREAKDISENGAALTTFDSEEFVRSHIGWMLAVARRVLQDDGLAEDAVQVAFTKVFSKLETFEGRSALKTWMHRIVVNEALMILRKNKRRREEPIDALLPEFDARNCRIEPFLTEFATPETMLQDSQTSRHVNQMIANLPDSYRIVLILRDIEGLSTREVGEALDMSETNVKVRLHRARAALKKLLEPFFKEYTL